MSVLRILHTSDLHGNVPLLLRALRGGLGEFDVWVDTGDLSEEPPQDDNPLWFAGYGRQMLEAQKRAVSWQKGWWLPHVPKILEALGETPAISVRGNHDWFPIHDHLATKAPNIHVAQPDKVLELLGLRWVGFDKIPPCAAGAFFTEADIESLVNGIVNLPECDVLLTHAPPSGPLSGKPEWGLVGLDNHPSWVHLCGHVHSRGGREVMTEGRRVINGADNARIVVVSTE